jgi:hypothetical protein
MAARRAPSRVSGLAAARGCQNKHRRVAGCRGHAPRSNLPVSSTAPRRREAADGKSRTQSAGTLFLEIAIDLYYLRVFSVPPVTARPHPAT